jgi:cyclophilin family peptidyl-prolyl cis-trans isomerase
MYKNVGGTPHLDNNYTVYGELVSGMDVLDAIATVKTAPGDRPVEDVRILQAKLLKKYKAKKEKKKKVEEEEVAVKKEKNVLRSEAQPLSDNEEEEKTSTKKKKK